MEVSLHKLSKLSWTSIDRSRLYRTPCAKANEKNAIISPSTSLMLVSECVQWMNNVCADAWKIDRSHRSNSHAFFHTNNYHTWWNYAVNVASMFYCRIHYIDNMFYFKCINFPPKQPRKFGIDKFTTPTAIGHKSHDFPIQCPIQCDICVLISKTTVIIIIIIIVIHLCKSGENNHQIKSTSTFMHRM